MKRAAVDHVAQCAGLPPFLGGGSGFERRLLRNNVSMSGVASGWESGRAGLVLDFRKICRNRFDFGKNIRQKLHYWQSDQ